MAGATNMPNNGVSVGNVALLIDGSSHGQRWGPLRIIASLILLADISESTCDLTVVDRSTNAKLYVANYSTRRKATVARQHLAEALADLPPDEKITPMVIQRLLASSTTR